jgi:hypothetical protein
MIGDRHIFDIAIYSVAAEKFFAGKDKKLQEYFDLLNKASLPDLPVRSPTSNDEFDRGARHYFESKYGGWQFTQVVGWIRLFPLVRQMRGEYWFVSAKRIDTHINRKNFEYYGKAFELSYFTGKESSLDIFHQTKEIIDRLKREKPFKGRYIDMETFVNIGPFVNWRELIGLDN